MSGFIQLSSAKAEAISRYKKEIRAIVIDRAADHARLAVARYKRPSDKTYEKALQDGLLRAKLDVLAELFRIMHDLARPSVVSQWSREDSGLRRKPRPARTLMDLVRAYDEVVRYVSNMKAHKVKH
ncbi:MAG: hypothetical protein R3E82_10255 [Pseudomonadales bacterium]|nr:hypothetical protein [Pseudomonadales bacterium]